ncbi:hypothetical protein I317_00314 [Kwoniella heveanensis CBS 569]|uniref:Nudix hydrolase domain-containing protein n=1 Tax=Kwoniella heveanensis BCC8398 TaxID=1296120 RepID=A0A1B9GNG7_9TREE|nr:hypothetical protein I316_05727 [Kwoniella heveanensis BCC8398]OCF45826.1 hypothetical protein I317_00314 [Kwoniella heveanensis CBS 569]
MTTQAPLHPIRPFTRPILQSIRAKLIPTTPPINSLPAHTIVLSDDSGSSGKRRRPAESAVLIPLLNIGGEAHVLMEVRDKGMRVHAGEASFPGGKADEDDPDLIRTALREAQEELALPPDNVEILGRLKPEYSLGNRARVWPFVGFIHSNPIPTLSESTRSLRQPHPIEATSEILSSLPTSRLIPSPTEVSAILPIPLSALQTPSRLSTHYFRLDTSKPYHKIRCEDYVVLPNKDHSSPAPTVSASLLKDNETSSTADDFRGLEVWGLSGWFLNKLAERVGWCEMPPKGVMPED